MAPSCVERLVERRAEPDSRIAREASAGSGATAAIWRVTTSRLRRAGAWAAFVGMTSVHDGCGTIEAVLEEALIGVVADRFRHLAFGVGDHAVGGNDDVALDAAHSGDAVSEDCEIAQQ